LLYKVHSTIFRGPAYASSGRQVANSWVDWRMREFFESCIL